MKLILVTLFFLLAACQTRVVQSDAPKECLGDFAEIRSNVKGQFEITFHKSVAEFVGGKVHCDFGTVPLKVDRPTYSSKKLKLIESLGKYKIEDSAFDPANPYIEFTVDGIVFVSSSENIERSNGLIKVRMRRLLPN